MRLEMLPFFGAASGNVYSPADGHLMTDAEVLAFLQGTAQLSPADAAAVLAAPFDNVQNVVNMISAGVPTYDALDQSRISPPATPAVTGAAPSAFFQLLTAHGLTAAEAAAVENNPALDKSSIGQLVTLGVGPAVAVAVARNAGVDKSSLIAKLTSGAAKASQVTANGLPATTTGTGTGTTGTGTTGTGTGTTGKATGNGVTPPTPALPTHLLDTQLFGLPLWMVAGGGVVGLLLLRRS